MRNLVSTLLCAVLALLVLQGCNQDLGLQGKTFACNDSSDCTDGFVCDTDREVCVSEDATGSPDATDTNDDATADTSDTDDTADDTTDDAEDTADVPNNCEVAAECPSGVACNTDGECEACTLGEQCLGDRVCVGDQCAPCSFEDELPGTCDSDTEICGPSNECVSSACDPSVDDCPEGYACDAGSSRCVRGQVSCSELADCNVDGGEVCNGRGRCVQWDASCTSPVDCAPGAQCFKGRCRPECDSAEDCKAICGDSCTCNLADGFCFGDSTPDCEGGGSCGNSLTCFLESGLCRPCDSRSDCGDTRNCSGNGQCVDISGTACSESSQCSNNEVCSEPSGSSGQCILWRCEYNGVDAGCNSDSYCRRFVDGTRQLNVCTPGDCNPGFANSCEGDTHCVGITDTVGVCEHTGSAGDFDTCSPGSSDEDSSCDSRSTCRQTAGGSYECQPFCDAWADDVGCAADAGTCVPTAGLLGTCQPNTQLNGDSTCGSAPALAPCAAKSVCIPETGGARCREVCRVDVASDCPGGVCNPAGVPGEIGWGQCTAGCSSDGDCEAGEVCFDSRYSNQSYCATRCGSDGDCRMPGMVCKDGVCD